MKNKFFYALIAAVVLFGGCSAKDEAKNVSLKIGFQANNASNEYAAAEFLAKRANELSDGTLSIEIFAGGQLGDDRSMIEQVKEGALDMVYAETGRFGLWIPEMEIFGYPFAFDDFEHLKRTLASEYGKGLHAKLVEEGWRILATGYNGTRHTTSNRAINSIEDMAGLKLRVPNAKANLEFAEYSGAAPTPMAFSEVYLALKTNAVDGQENPLSTINAQKFYEVQKYCALTGHILNDNNYVMSEVVWKKLSEKQQKALKQAAEEAAELQTSKFMEDETSLIESFKANGMEITSPEKKPFRDAMAPVYEKYISTYGKEAIEAIDSAR